MIPRPLSIALTLAWLTAGIAADASGSESVALTNQPTLNDLIRRIPVHSRRREQAQASLGAIQEMVILHERKMKGEGLPPVQRVHFSANYSSILGALIDDRITEEYGRDLLAHHRHLLADAYRLAERRSPDAKAAQALVVELKQLGEDLLKNAESVSVIPDSVRTPLINGHQLWVEELLVWGCHSRELSRGALGHLGVLATRLERFERAYKRDGRLHRSERERLHQRLIDLQRALIAVLERNRPAGLH